MRLLVAGACAAVACAAPVSCLTADGKAIDWWVAERRGVSGAAQLFPPSPSPPTARCRWLIFKFHGGYGYAYSDSVTPPTAPPTLQPGSISDGSALTVTMDALIAARNGGTAAMLLWNDEEAPTNDTAATRATADVTGSTDGHTKGILVGGTSNTGVFITHSVPLFPTLTTPFTWTTSTTYGQHLMCISLTTSTTETAAQQLQWMDPYFFNSVVPAGLTNVYPNMAAVLAGQRASGT